MSSSSVNDLIGLFTAMPFRTPVRSMTSGTVIRSGMLSNPLSSMIPKIDKSVGMMIILTVVERMKPNDRNFDNL